MTLEEFLHHPETTRIITQGLAEDIKEGDHTSLSTIPAGTKAKARCLVKGDGILAGVAFAEQVALAVNPDFDIDIRIPDGERVKHGDEAFYISGEARDILQAERLLLNAMQRMSGIATMSRQVTDLLEGTGCKVLDTRKTTPLVRHLEKWAVAIGGGVNHRFGLYDMILIKDNHIDVAGGIGPALSAAKTYTKDKNLGIQIEIETRSLDEVQAVLDEGGADRILLDNMNNETLSKAVSLIGDRCATEASGGITLETVRGVAETGVDYVSMGALTHSYTSLDISLKVMIEK
ncbi:MAG: carboxylating nicotinate-nucleotide diphosphorylase [Bacteroidia bacterium]